MLAHLTLWQRVVLFVEDDAAQLGMDLATYYAICALVGLLQGLSFFRCVELAGF